MRWIGQLKRLSSGWPPAIKSSLTGYSDVAEGRLYLCLIQLFYCNFLCALSSTDLYTGLQSVCDSLLNTCYLLVYILHLKTCLCSPQKAANVLICLEMCCLSFTGNKQICNWWRSCKWAGGWGQGRLCCCKPVTKPGFETVIWQFQALSY